MREQAKYPSDNNEVAESDIMDRLTRVHAMVDLIFSHVETCGYIDLGPQADLWSRQGLLQPELPPPFRPRRFRDKYRAAPFWITFVGGRASIPLHANDHAALIQVLREADLRWAAQGGHTLVAHALLELGEGVNQADPDGFTPLHWAVSSEEIDTVRLLLTHGADANFPDNAGRTPLHVAAYEGVMELATLLLCAGSDPGLVDDEGDSARDIAQRAGHDELALLFGRVVSHHQANELTRLTLPAAGAADRDAGSLSRRRL